MRTNRLIDGGRDSHGALAIREAAEREPGRTDWRGSLRPRPGDYPLNTRFEFWSRRIG